MRPRTITDDQILAAMRKGVLAHGPQVPLETVAAELNVTAPALLKRFGTRQALMVAALRPAEEPAWVKELQNGPGDESLEDQLVGILERIGAFFRETMPCIMALRESGIPIDCVFPKPASPEHGRKALRHWLERAAKRGLVTVSELDAAAYALLGSMQAHFFFGHLMKAKHSARAERAYIQDLTRLFCRALTGNDKK